MGDFGFALGILAIFLMFDTVSFDAVFSGAPGMVDAEVTFLGHSFDFLEVACILLFVGAMGKSAQFLLHTWLPDAMEGPDAGLGADPRRDHGDRRRLHGGAALADLRIRGRSRSRW